MYDKDCNDQADFTWYTSIVYVRLKENICMCTRCLLPHHKAIKNNPRVVLSVNVNVDNGIER